MTFYTVIQTLAQIEDCSSLIGLGLGIASQAIPSNESFLLRAVPTRKAQQEPAEPVNRAGRKWTRWLCCALTHRLGQMEWPLMTTIIWLRRCCWLNRWLNRLLSALLFAIGVSAGGEPTAGQDAGV